MGRARGQRRHPTMREIDAALAGSVPKKVADVAAELFARRGSSMATSRMPARTPKARTTTARDLWVASWDTQS